MYVRKDYAPSTHKKAALKDFGPAFHFTERVSKYAKTVKTRCGLDYVVADIEVKEDIGDAKFCGQCNKLLKGTDLRVWASTGYAKNA